MRKQKQVESYPQGDALFESRKYQRQLFSVEEMKRFGMEYVKVVG